MEQEFIKLVGCETFYLNYEECKFVSINPLVVVNDLFYLNYEECKCWSCNYIVFNYIRFYLNYEECK